MKKFTGIFTALVTPFDKNGNVDHDALKKLIDKLIDEGVSGFYVVGSTGECFLLSDEERNSVVKTATEYTNKRVKVIIHVGSLSTKQSISFAKFAEECGADAISAVPPFYYKYSIDEVVDHYMGIMDSVDLPFIAYNFPALAGIELTVDSIKKLNEHKNFTGIKFTSKDLFTMEQFQTIDEELCIFNGHDEMYISALPYNAAGAIGSTFNFMAPKFIKMTELFKAKDIEGALALQKEANTIISAMIGCGVQQTVKYFLGKQGIECNGCRRPAHELTAAQKSILDGVYDLI